VSRIKKCCQILGRAEGNLTAAQILYPLMQCADIFFLKADVCQLGVDQRKVNMLAREYCDSIGRKLKPVILSHHMIAGLKAGQAKMSKSDPDSAVFMEDTAEDVRRKIMNAHCPKVEQSQDAINEDGSLNSREETNPCLDYVRSIVFSLPGAVFPTASGMFTSYESVEAAFLAGALEENDLKEAIITAINNYIEPVRNHFATNAEAGALLEKVRTFRATKSQPMLDESTAPTVDAATPTIVFFVPGTTRLTLSDALGVVGVLESAARGMPDAKVIVYLTDWRSNARDDFANCDEKDSVTVHQYNAELLKALGLPSNANIAQQSTVILANPNEYWLNVIYAGRKLQVGQVEQALGNVERAGQIISTLMLFADILALSATHCLASADVLSELTLIRDTFLPNTELVPIPSTVPLLCDPNVEQVTSAEDILFLDDTEMDLRRKIKRGYCKPGETTNAFFAIASHFINSQGALPIVRSPENGGVTTIGSVDELASQCQSEQLHPGDLKAAVSTALVTATAGVREFLAGGTGKKIATAFKTVEKKTQKKK
jgi:tyrosyl-tRNA synthetase